LLRPASLLDRSGWVAAGLVVLVALVYSASLGYPFVAYDDDVYVTANTVVQDGLTVDGLAWALTSTGFNWTPLTWLSHMLDVELFGTDAGGHHLTSLVLHAANTVLLFFMLRRMTGRPGASALVAAVFAVHPLQVESVVWVASRKHLLATLFGLLALGAWLRYLDRPGRGRYAAVAGLFAMSLLAKATFVTLPLLLLVLDRWPLGRDGEPGAQLRLLAEKVPLFLLAGVSSAVTFLAQRAGGSLASFELIDPAARVGNALVAYLRYLGKMVWPSDLAVYYPHAGAELPAGTVALAALVLLTVTVAAVTSFRRTPLATGWLWYLITLVPMIGLVQVGTYAMADRYAYIPLVGVAVIAVFGGSALLERIGHRAVVRGAPLVALGIVAGLGLAAHGQVGAWRDSRTLFEQALSVEPGAWPMRNNLGFLLEAEGKLEEAAGEYAEATRLAPEVAKSHVNLGSALLQLGRAAEAEASFARAVERDPASVDARLNLGITQLAQGRPVEGIETLAEAASLAPDDWRVGHALGRALSERGDFVPAESVLATAEQSLVAGPRGKAEPWTVGDPDLRQAALADVRAIRGMLLARLGRVDEAVASFEAVLQVQPGRAETRCHLALALFQRGDVDGSRREVDACRRDGGTPDPAFVRMLEAAPDA
jgi:thioredoxin-like negative regulator of GroEL